MIDVKLLQANDIILATDWSRPTNFDPWKPPVANRLEWIRASERFPVVVGMTVAASVYRCGAHEFIRAPLDLDLTGSL